MSVWVVRSGDTANENEALAKGFLALGYGIDRDIGELKTLEDIRALLHQLKPDVSDGTISAEARQVRAFKESIAVGDLIVMPRMGGSTVVFGEMSGAYFYLPDNPRLPHARAVTWLNTEVHRSEMEADLQRSMNAQGAVYQPRCDEAEFRLKTIAESGRDPYLTHVSETDSKWDEIVRRAQAYVDSGRLETEEIEYKVEMGRRLALARISVNNKADDWRDLVKRGISGNLIYSVEMAKFWDWLDAFPDDALLALQALWTDEDVGVDERLRDFTELLPASTSSGPGVRTTLGSVLLMGVDVERYPPFRVRLFNEAYLQTGYPPPQRGANEAEIYDHALGFLDTLIEEAAARGLQLRHRLDGQSVIWAALNAEDEDSPEAIEEESDEGRDPLPAVKQDPWSTEKIARLAADLLWEPEQLQEILDDLTEKGQVIFYGPPGTGKTYVARALARHCRLHGGDFDIVQFHPSYSYEDFVEGYRPRLINGQPGFELVSGPLLRIAEKARENHDAFFILVIDELNRGNVAKVFGELYFLLEYRGEEVRLQYGGDRPGFSLPPNLWFICTMNTADRSIALMDAALRRRFFFAPFFPDEPPIRGLLRRWLEREGQDTLAADLVDTANKRLDRDMGIGPSYFMSGETLDESRVRRIWRRSVLPYIEEQFFGDADKLSEFTVDRLKLSLKGPVPAAGEETGDNSNESGDSTRNDNVIIDPS